MKNVKCATKYKKQRNQTSCARNVVISLYHSETNNKDLDG